VTEAPADPASDTQASDTQASDTQVSDTQASDTQASDTQASDTQASDTQASDTQASDTQASDTHEPFAAATPVPPPPSDLQLPLFDIREPEVPAPPATPEVSASPDRYARGLLVVTLLVVLSLLVSAGTTAVFLRRWSDENMPKRVIALPSIDRALSVGEIAEAVGPSVVSIQTAGSSAAGNAQSAGTGFVVDDSGLIATNAHVVEGAQILAVVLPNGSRRTARLVLKDSAMDLAFVQVDDTSGLKPAVLGSSERLQVGDDVVAIGNALNLGASPTVTVGIVSAKDRAIVDQGKGLSVQGLIQTDAAINPGNSGGPLVNSLGEVVGINTAVASDAQNVGFALAIDDVIPYLDDAEQAKPEASTGPGFLGINIANAAQLNQRGLESFSLSVDQPGAVVINVIPFSPAEISGIEVGDVVVAFDGQPIASAEALTEMTAASGDGTDHTIEVLRAGERITLEVSLTARTGS
jgi:serine protease Do